MCPFQFHSDEYHSCHALFKIVKHIGIKQKVCTMKAYPVEVLAAEVDVVLEG